MNLESFYKVLLNPKAELQHGEVGVSIVWTPAIFPFTNKRTKRVEITQIKQM